MILLLQKNLYVVKITPARIGTKLGIGFARFGRRNTTTFWIDMKIHKTVTIDRIIATIEHNNLSLENVGICLACGEDNDSCEPDARNYECESCGSRQVFGAEELLMRYA